MRNGRLPNLRIIISDSSLRETCLFHYHIGRRRGEGPAGKRVSVRTAQKKKKPLVYRACHMDTTHRGFPMSKRWAMGRQEREGNRPKRKVTDSQV